MWEGALRLPGPHMTDGISNMEVDGFRNAMNGRTVSRILDLVSDDIAFTDSSGQVRTGKGEFGQYLTAWFGAFPDYAAFARTTTIQGWSATLEVSITATNLGPLPLPGGDRPPRHRQEDPDGGRLGAAVQHGAEGVGVPRVRQPDAPVPAARDRDRSVGRSRQSTASDPPAQAGRRSPPRTVSL